MAASYQQIHAPISSKWKAKSAQAKAMNIVTKIPLPREMAKRYLMGCNLSRFGHPELTRTVLIRLEIKVRPKGLHSFAFYILIFAFSLLSSTSVESPLQIAPFMQNKPNLVRLRRIQNPYLTTIYEQKTVNCEPENKPNQTQPVVSLSNLFQNHTLSDRHLRSSHFSYYPKGLKFFSCKD